MSTPAYAFTSRIVRHDLGMQFHILPVPDAVAARMKADGTRRLAGTLNGSPMRRALQGSAENGYHLVTGRAFMDAHHLKLGIEVHAVLTPDPEPDRIEMPEELAIALEQDEEGQARWETFTSGNQRGFCHYVSTAKREATRIKRAVELVAKIRTHQLWGDLHKK